MNLINPIYKFSFFKNLYSVKAPDGELDINQLIEIVKYGYIKSDIEKLRNAIDDKERYNEIKRENIPSVTLSGIYKFRNKESIICHSGLMQVDLDDVKDYEQILEKLVNDTFTYVCFRSPGGKGVKVIVKILPEVETHLDQFYALQRYYKEEYDIAIDPSCKDIARCMLLSYDPNLFCNPFAAVFEECYNPYPVVKTKGLPQSKIFTIKSNPNSTEVIAYLINEVSTQKIDITDTYDNWIRLGFGLSAEFGEGGREYFHQLSQFHEGYDYEKCDAQYTKLSRSNTGAIKFGTIVHLAKSKGIEFKFNEKSQIHKVPAQDLKPKSLKELLLAKRNEIAAREHKSIYSVFQDRTITELETHLPSTLESFKKILGVTYQKSCYANDFLPIIKAYLVQEGKAEVSIVKDNETIANAIPSLSLPEEELYDELRHLRIKIGQEANIKAYNVFRNTTLEEIVRFKPSNRAALIAIKGLGEKKVNWFGHRILDIVAKYV